MRTVPLIRQYLDKLDFTTAAPVKHLTRRSSSFFHNSSPLKKAIKPTEGAPFIEGLALIALDDADVRFTLDAFIELCTSKKDDTSKFTEKAPDVARVLVEKLTKSQLHLLKKNLFAREKKDSFLRSDGSSLLLKNLLQQEMQYDQNFKNLIELLKSKFSKFQRMTLNEKPSKKPKWNVFLDDLTDLLTLNRSITKTVRERVGENKIDDEQPTYDEVVELLKKVLAEKDIQVTDEMDDELDKALRRHRSFTLSKEILNQLSADLRDCLAQILNQFPEMAKENISLIAATLTNAREDEILYCSMGYLFFTLINSHVLVPMLTKTDQNSLTYILLRETFVQPFRCLVTGKYQSYTVSSRDADIFFQPVFDEYYKSLPKTVKALLDNTSIDNGIITPKFNKEDSNRELALDLLKVAEKVLDSNEKEHTQANLAIHAAFLQGHFSLITTYIERPAIPIAEALRQFRSVADSENDAAGPEPLTSPVSPHASLVGR